MNTTINSLLDQAIEKLPPFKKLVYKRLLKRPEGRSYVLSLLLPQLQEDNEAVAMLPIAATDSLTGLTPITIDPDKLDKFLEVILKYLPQILDIILKLFL